MTNTEVTAYLPQRPPFVMVDAIIEANDIKSVTSFTVNEGHQFVTNGYFTEPGIVENMAQTAAAGTGYSAKINNRPAPIGYIGAIKNLVINKLPKTGDTITTESSFLHHVLNVHVVVCKVYLNNDEIAQCEMKIFVQSESHA